MAFWSGDTIEARLSSLIDKPDKACVDCAAYMLKVGPEYYVTPSDRTSDPKSATLQKLEPGDTFPIPPGQFAFVLTEEIVTVPKNVLAFISIRAKVKFKGLINVSGFHVDPGYSDRLTFAVFNAGPVPVHLRRGDPEFLIWFADLDGTSKKYFKPARAPSGKMDISIINQVAGEVYSLQGLADTIRQTEKDLADRITSLERSNGIVKVVAGAMITFMVAFGVQWVVRQFAAPSTSPVIQAPPHEPGNTAGAPAVEQRQSTPSLPPENQQIRR